MFEHKDFQKAIFDNYQHELTQPLTQQPEAIPAELLAIIGGNRKGARRGKVKITITQQIADGMNIEVNADQYNS